MYIHMASMTLFLFAVLFANQVTAQQNHSTVIRLGSSISPRNSTWWVSASGLFTFGFYPKGNGFAVGIWLKGEPQNTIVWTANRDDPPVSSDSIIKLTKDGLVLLRSKKDDVNLNALLELATSASMLDSGNFVLYNGSHSVIWQSFDFPTHTILGGQSFSNDFNPLVSALSNSDHSSGYFSLSQSDDELGNLFAYPLNRSTETDSSADAYVYWSTHLPNDFAYYPTLSLNVTGFLEMGGGENVSSIYVLANGTYLGKSTTSVYRATLDVDGNFRTYVHQFENNTRPTIQVMWEALSDQCEVNGFCGFNSYCSTNRNRSVCQCYPGFKQFKGSSDMFLDCKQINNDVCETSADPEMLYNVNYTLKLEWRTNPYLVIPLEREACGKSCLEDCNCGAARYKNGSCEKFNLPLLFGRHVQNSSSTAIFKTPLTNKTTTNRPPSFERKPGIRIDDKKSLILTLLLTLGSISFICLVFGAFIFFFYRRQVYSYTKLSESASLRFTEDCTLRTFSFDELVNSTGNFKEEVGRGSFGVVYKGAICGCNRSIAVKKLDVVVDEGEREFQAEITAIARTHHRNLVQLIGYCIDGSKKLLVYQYMSNGSLADFLFKAEMRLSWRQRVKIALDVARAILYLHEECEVCIVHCNIKPQNILMDEMWTAKLSDFGLARLIMPEHSSFTTRNEITSGYMAPEWQKDASTTSVKVDIYSYGMVLLEIICCRRNTDVKASSTEEIMLSSWAYNCFVRGELSKLVVDEDVEWNTMERMVKVALWCVQKDLSLRPSMKNVILMLEGLKHIPIPPSPTPLV